MVYVHPITAFFHQVVSILALWSINGGIITNSNPLPPPANQGITITTFNVWALPAALPGHDQANRFQKLPNQIASLCSDIIALQEVFRPSIKDKIAKQMIDKNYHISSDISKSSRRILGFLDMDRYGGLITISAYPIIVDTFVQYPIRDGMNIEEKWARKGFLVSIISTPDGPLIVINTHLYAGKSENAENMRMSQLMFMMDYLLNTVDYYRYPTILVGDLNITHPAVAEAYADLDRSTVYEALLNMGFYDSSPVINKDDLTIDPEGNAYKKKERHAQKLDYCFYHVPDMDCHNQIEIVGAYRTFATPETCISDHYGWCTKMKIYGEAGL